MNDCTLNHLSKLSRTCGVLLCAFVCLFSASQLLSQSLCENGFAGDFPCDRFDLLGELSNADMMGTAANDVWGWTDPETGVEYALVGERQGLALVDISDPYAPFLVAFMETQTSSSTWRDMKVYADHVYVAWSDPEHTLLMAIDHAGETVWTQDLGPWVSQHGFGTSPMLYGGTVILANHQQGKDKLPPGGKPGISSMAAFDCKTGEPRWRTPRESTVAAYSVPCVLNRNGRDELVCCSNAHGIFSLDPTTGKPLWEVKDAFSMRTVSSPAIAGGLVIGTTGSGGGGNYVVAVRPGDKAKVVYKIDRQAPYVPTPIEQGGLLYLWYDKGVVTCLEAETGEQVWQKRVGGNYSGSPIIAGDKLYCIDEEGEVVVLATGRTFKELGRNPLGEGSRTTPAVSEGRMFFRTDRKLFCLSAVKS